MPTLKEIRKNLETVSAIKSIASTYQEIANLRMRRIREKVLKNRQFFKELLGIYQRVKSAYLSSLKKKPAKKERVSFRRVEKEKIVVFLSANQFFYGALILDIWKEVQKYLENQKTDLAVVGRTGKYLAEGAGFGHRMYYFELDDVKPEKGRIGEIVEFIKKYRQVLVFHGRYEGVLFQKPVMSEISGELPFEQKAREVKNYLFEPSPEAILDFFETEIVATLFNQTILEHQLARYASRVMAMYRATENAKRLEKKLQVLENKLERQKLNKRQIEFFGSHKF